MHILPVPPASNRPSGLGPLETQKWQSNRLGIQSRRWSWTLDELIQPCANLGLPIFSRFVLWGQYIVLYMFISVRQTFCYLKPKMFLTDTAVRPGFELRKLNSKACEFNNVIPPHCTLLFALFAVATPTPKFFKTTLFALAPKPLLFPVPGGTLYSPFRSQLKYHLFRRAFPDLFTFARQSQFPL